MQGIVWYHIRENGFKKMQQIMNHYKMAGIKIDGSSFYRSKNSVKIRYENGDTWKCVPAIESQRGNKANIAIIERSIDKNFFQEIIMPTLTMSPYTAINFYSKGELGWK